jgi:phosphatidate cytidylyltransferase
MPSHAQDPAAPAPPRHSTEVAEPPPEAAAGEPTAEERPPKAGRNLKVAVPVAISLIALLTLSVVFSPWPFVGLVCVALVLGLWELSGAFARRDMALPLIPLAVGGVATQLAAAYSGLSGLIVAFSVTVVGALAWRLLDGRDKNFAADAAAIVFAAVYLPLLAGFAVLVVFMPWGQFLAVALVALPVANDTGGYATGVLFGRHPLVPSVSPKKTWEGLGGSLLLTCAVGVAVVIVLDGPWYMGLGLGAVATAASTLGDLAESMLKRALDVKDMGHLLPGHGGVLDRLDSILMTAPLAYIVLTLVEAGAFS